jgi:hypothetical protein
MLSAIALITPESTELPSRGHRSAGSPPKGSASGVPTSAEIIWRATVGYLATKLIRFPSGDQSTNKAHIPLAILSFWLSSNFERHNSLSG